MQKLLIVTKGYVLSALFTMTVATLVFCSVSLVAHYTVGMAQIIAITATIAGLLFAIWTLRATSIVKTIAQLLESKTTNNINALDRSTGYLPERNWNYSTRVLSVAGKAQYLCVALSEEWYAENKIFSSPSKKLQLWNFSSGKDLHLGPIRKNTKYMDYLINSIRVHEDALRSHGIHHVHIQHFKDYTRKPWVDEHYADFAFEKGKILFVILECSSEWSKVEEGWARDIVAHSCGDSFANIVGIKGGVRDMKTLPSLPPMIDTGEAIGVF